MFNNAFKELITSHLYFDTQPIIKKFLTLKLFFPNETETRISFSIVNLVGLAMIILKSRNTTVELNLQLG